MEIDTQHGLKGILVSLAGIILAYLVKDIIKGIYAYRNRHKAPTREEFKELTKALQEHTEILREQKNITDKMSIDVRRIYLFLKVIAGQKWPEYRSQVKEIENLDS